MKIQEPVPGEVWFDEESKVTTKTSFETLKSKALDLWAWGGILFRCSIQVRATNGAMAEFRILLNGKEVHSGSTSETSLQTFTSPIRRYADYTPLDRLSSDLFEFQLKTSDSAKKAVMEDCKIEVSDPVETEESRYEAAFSEVNHASVGVKDSSTQVLAKNPQRKYACIQNVSDTGIFLALGASAILNSGYFLAAGEKFEITSRNLFKGEINGIHSATGLTKTVLVVEGY